MIRTIPSPHFKYPLTPPPLRSPSLFLVSLGMVTVSCGIRAINRVSSDPSRKFPGPSQLQTPASWTEDVRQEPSPPLKQRDCSKSVSACYKYKLQGADFGDGLTIVQSSPEFWGYGKHQTLYRRHAFARTPPDTSLSSLFPVTLLSPLAYVRCLYTACLVRLVTPWITRCGAADSVGRTVLGFLLLPPHLHTYYRTPHTLSLFVLSTTLTPRLSHPVPVRRFGR